MNIDSRLNNSMRNTVYGVIGMLAMLMVSFIAKSIFIRELGNVFNGVDYLFRGILNALNLAELGFASAVAFSLYKPLSEGDTETISALMNYFKRVYRIIAVVVAVTGSLCIPFLQYLIKEDLATLPFTIGELRFYYIFYLANTILSYLLAYKRTIISADQQAYIITTVDYSFNIILNLLQIVLLILTRSYFSFLIIMLAKTVINNVVLAIIANKKYPYLLYNKSIELSSSSKKALFKNVKALMLHKIGAVVIINTSTIVVSAFVGVYENSLYGNYMMICGQVLAFINIVFNSVTASIGNLCAEAEIDKQISVFDKMNYLSLWAGYFVFICLVCLFNPFMDIWLGPGMTFGIEIVVLIAFNQCISFLRKSVMCFKDAKGLFVIDRYKPLIEAGVSLSLAIPLGKYYGVGGIVIGYSLGSLCVAFPIEIWALFKFGFYTSPRKYIYLDVLASGFTGVICLLMYKLIGFLGSGILFFLLKLLLCLVIPNLIFILVTCRTSEFKYFFNIFKSN